MITIGKSYRLSAFHLCALLFKRFAYMPVNSNINTVLQYIQVIIDFKHANKRIVKVQHIHAFKFVFDKLKVIIHCRVNEIRLC